MKLSQKNTEAFLMYIGDLVYAPLVLKLENFSQHTIRTTRYRHCILVAYISFLLARKFHLDIHAAVRGAMLHDLYFESWPGSDKGTLSRWKTHPAAAKSNASVFDLSTKEEDIIEKHMWPLTLAMPRYKESYVVSLADKLAAMMEGSRLVLLLHLYDNFIFNL